jgi:uncharacterized protein
MTMTTSGTATRQRLAVAVDTNILIHAWSRESPWHQQAADLMDRLEFGTTEWAIPDPCLCEYYRVVTNSKKFENPATLRQAREQIEFWLALPHVVVLCEYADDEDDYWACFDDILKYTEVKGRHVFDARVAAICITHHVGELWTQDKGFGRFKGLKVRNPLDDDLGAGVFAEEVAAEEGLAGSGDHVAVDG